MKPNSLPFQVDWTHSQGTEYSRRGDVSFLRPGCNGHGGFLLSSPRGPTWERLADAVGTPKQRPVGSTASRPSACGSLWVILKTDLVPRRACWWCGTSQPLVCSRTRDSARPTHWGHGNGDSNCSLFQAMTFCGDLLSSNGQLTPSLQRCPLSWHIGHLYLTNYGIHSLEMACLWWSSG